MITTTMSKQQVLDKQSQYLEEYYQDYLKFIYRISQRNMDCERFALIRNSTVDSPVILNYVVNRFHQEGFFAFRVWSGGILYVSWDDPCFLTRLCRKFFVRLLHLVSD